MPIRGLAFMSKTENASRREESYKDLTLDGVRVCYLDVGRGEPVLLLHGYPQSHRCWRHQIDDLAQTHRVIAPDWPGFGSSERRLEVAPLYAAEAERIGKLADQLGLQRFNLITHDYGGHLALGFMSRSPERVLRFAVINSRAHATFSPRFYRFSVFQHWFASHALSRAVARRLPIGSLHRRGFERYLRLGCFTRAELNDYLSWMDDRAGRDYYLHFFTHYHVPTRPELAAVLPTIRCPTAIIWGTRDPYIPLATAHELAERIPNATLTLLDGADHFPMEERPREVSEALRELLDRPLHTAIANTETIVD